MNKLKNIISKTNIPKWIVDKSETLGLLINEQSKFVVGNERLRAIILLSSIGAYYKTPVHLAITGDTQAGKSFLVKKTIELFENSFFKSGITPKSLIYKCKEKSDSLNNSIICFDDIDNSTSEDILSTIKQLTSEKKSDGSIIYETVQHLKYTTIEISGYFTFFFTTADFPGDEQLKSRFLQIPCMLDQHLANIRLNKKLEKFVNQSEFEDKELKFISQAKKMIREIIESPYKFVEISYLHELNIDIFLMNDRMLDIFLSLIHNSAIFNQKNREKKEPDFIISSKKDAYLVFDLLKDFFVYNEMDLKITESQKYILDELPLEIEVESWTYDYDDKDSVINHSANPGMTISQIETKLINSGNQLNTKTIHKNLKSLFEAGYIGRYKRSKGTAHYYYKFFTNKNKNYSLFKGD